MNAINGVPLPTTEQRIITNGASFTGVFSGDTVINGFWGVAIMNAINGVPLPTTEQRIITNGASFTGVFSGDTVINGFWGVAMFLAGILL